ncbi:hypothetical protein [Granulicoccus phenolivorans]|uniref:hypothetical protein n=1 Tax=Granulicoccus phenolivorans TaxID=266854 RepID=UPI000686F192|nr:hypothetical protein [Granulicoccus phenolivorans]
MGRAERRFGCRWIVAVSIGEAIGFAVATATAITAILLRVDDVQRLLLAVAAGAVEGAALASGQYAAMTHHRPPLGRWTAATAAGAALAWLLGMLPSTVGFGPDSVGAVVVFAVGAVVLLGAIPMAQWLALHRRGTFRWVPINMGAWLVAVLWTAAPSPLVDESTPIPLIATLYVLAGVLMALTIAVLTVPVARSLFGR